MADAGPIQPGHERLAERAPTEPDTPDVVALPPALYAGALAAALLVELALPLPGLPEAISWTLGAILFAAGAALGIWFLRSFRRARTPVDLRRPTTTIVTTGPYRFSRNPGYLSLTMMYAGVAVLADALWPLFALPIVLVVIQRGVIEREERYLERTFGDEYLAYKARVRRWI